MTNQTARASHPPRRALGGARTCTPCTGGGRRRAGRDVRDGSARAALQDKPVGTRQHRAASHETRVERVTARAALFVMQNVPASHAVQTVAVPVAWEHVPSTVHVRASHHRQMPCIFVSQKTRPMQHACR